MEDQAKIVAKRREEAYQSWFDRYKIRFEQANELLNAATKDNLTDVKFLCDTVLSTLAGVSRDIRIFLDNDEENLPLTAIALEATLQLVDNHLEGVRESL